MRFNLARDGFIGAYHEEEDNPVFPGRRVSHCGCIDDGETLGREEFR